MTDLSREPATEADAALPPFYRRPLPLNPARHARAGLAPRAGFGFARDTNAIVLAGAEFALAARCYPIAFTASAPVTPVAVVGLRDRHNAFVDAQGQWRPDSYVPAYVRRYPFIFMNDDAASRLILCVDEDADEYRAEAQQPFFDADQQPNAAVREVLQFCESYQAQYEDTLRFGEWLQASGLLEERVARAELAGGEVFTLSGFRLVSPEKMRALSDEQVLELHRRGWLPLLHFHLQSLDNWALLVKLTGGAAG